MIMVLGFCPSPHCHLYIYQVVLKLFAGQGTRQTDRRTKRRLNASPFGEHKNPCVVVNFSTGIYRTCYCYMKLLLRKFVP